MSKFLDIAANYDAFLLDLWGVVHDGSALYPGVLEVLRALKQQNKTVIFLSNAPRRSTRVISVLDHLGVDASLYSAAVSSGEVGFLWLQSGAAPFGKSYYYIGPDKDLDVLDGLNYVRVADLNDADFLLNVGFGTEAQSDEDISPLLKDAYAKHLPMLCLNPDMEVVKITGERYPCAGVIGKAYEALGGKVTWFGKPYKDVYEHCFRLLSSVSKNKILAVGDSLATDIKGGVSAGLNTVLVAGGILKHHTSEELAALCTDVKPAYIVPSLGN